MSSLQEAPIFKAGHWLNTAGQLVSSTNFLWVREVLEEASSALSLQGPP